jgi:selenocysteine-specific elongation factor
VTVVVGTAGHIDHGKTTLLLALTGIDADRLPEERRRGMTIDVGYAYLELPDGTSLDLVDVPGHDRLVGNMLVGAGEVDAALLVIAADDGPRAQTLEHLELLDALGLRRGVVAVTKIDVVDDERVAAVVSAVTELVGRTTLAGAPVVAVSALRGDGLDQLRTELVGLRDRVMADRLIDGAAAPHRLAIDRAFSVKGRGLVVTGSLRGGPVSRGVSLRLEPGGQTARARELQVHGRATEQVLAGGRVALNLAGIDAKQVTRGTVLTDDPAVVATDRIVAILRPPTDLGRRAVAPAWPPPPGAILRLHVGTASVDAAIRRGRRDVADLADGRRVATLRLAAPLAVAVGDPFVLRVPSPPATAAGGVILDVGPPIGPSARRLSPAILAEVAQAWLAADSVRETAARVRLHGLLLRAVPDTIERGSSGVLDARPVADWWLTEEVAAALDDEARRSVGAQHDAQPLAGGMPSAELRRELARSLRRQVTTDERTAGRVVAALVDALVEGGELVRSGDRIGDPTRPNRSLSPEVLAAMDRLEAILAVPGPPALAEAAARAGCPVEGVRALESSGRMVRVEADLAWSASAYGDLEDTALRLASPGPLTPAALRDATGTSRKYVMVLLEDLARRGVLARTPEGHVRGPRAPR